MTHSFPTRRSSDLEQRELFIRKTLEGDYIWGQGYSEPGAGSDLASVRTRGELSADGSKWIINGQKIWTSQGMQATHMFMRSEEHTSELQSLMRISYAVFCLKKK